MIDHGPIDLVILLNGGLLLLYLFVQWFQSLLPVRVRYSEETPAAVSRTGWAVAMIFVGIVAGLAIGVLLR